MKKIKLTQNEFALVDDSDFEWLNQWRWSFLKSGYAIRNKPTDKNGKRGLIWMHRLINKTPEGFETDHINRNKLDNRRSNLRTVTKSQNQMNRKLHKSNHSGYNGICWDNLTHKYKAQIRIDNKQIHLGLYSSIQGAWLARRFGERIKGDL